MKKKIKTLVKRGIPFIIALIVFISSFCLSAFAVIDNERVFSINRPITDDHSCYFEIVNDTGAAYVLSIYFRWQVNGVKDQQWSSDDYHIGVSYDYVSYRGEVDTSGNLWVDLYNVPYYVDTSCLGRGNVVGILYDQQGNTSDVTVQQSSTHWRVGVYVGKNYQSVVPYNATGALRSNGVTFSYGGNSTHEQTNQIVNGWEDEKPDVDSSTTDDFVTKEDGIHQDIKPGLDDTAQIVGGLQDNIQSNDLNLYEGLLASTQLMNVFMDEKSGIKPIYLILGVSLSLGLFAFVLGMIQMLNKIGSSHKDDNYISVNKHWYNKHITFK